MKENVKKEISRAEGAANLQSIFYVTFSVEDKLLVRHNKRGSIFFHSISISVLVPSHSYILFNTVYRSN